MRVAKRNESEQWQRLRAARAFSGLSQEELRAAMHQHGVDVSRALISLWVGLADHNRTAPSMEHLKAYARACRVPLDYLMDDTAVADVKAIREYIDHPPRGAVVNEDAHNAERFWCDVRDAILKLDPTTAPEVNQTIPCKSGLSFRIGLLRPHCIAHCVYDTSSFEPLDAMLRAQLGYLLMAERALDKRVRKYLLIYTKTPLAIDEEHLSAQYGVTVKQFTERGKAVRFMLNL